jgi:F-type H+-transporting ATPase subunit a
MGHEEEMSLDAGAAFSELARDAHVADSAKNVEAHASAGNGIHQISIRAEELFRLGPLAVTNSFAFAVAAGIMLVALALALRRSLRTVPGRLQGFGELFVEGALGLMEPALGSRERAARYLPLIGTLFLFILASNWFGLLPLSHFFVGATPLFRAPTADLNFTVALAVVSVIGVNTLGAAAIGVRGHLGKFFNFSNPIQFFIGILEFVSEFVKMISFSFRLFGNIFAGEVLLTIVGFLAPFVIPLPFLFLEVFVGLIQALIFSMLTLVFLGMATVAHEHEPAH